MKEVKFALNVYVYDSGMTADWLQIFSLKLSKFRVCDLARAEVGRVTGTKQLFFSSQMCFFIFSLPNHKISWQGASHFACIFFFFQGQKFGENPFSPRFLSTELQESKWILLNISVYHTMLYGKNPWILAKFYQENSNYGFSYLVANFWPCFFQACSYTLYNSKWACVIVL